MHNWRRFVSLAMVCFICCVALRGGASAADYQFAPVANDMISPVELRPDGVSLMSVASTATVTASAPILYGVSGSNYASFTSGYLTSMSDYSQLVGQGFSDTDGLYLSVPSCYIDLTFDVSGAYPGTESVEFWGTFDGRLGAWSSGGELSTTPYKYSLLVNGQVVADYTDGGSFSYTDTLDVGESVTSFSVRYYYSQYFDLGAFSIPDTIRTLYINPGSVETNVSMSDQGFFDSLFSWLSGIRDGITGVASSISSGFGNLINSITQLPSKIADVVKGLFVPSDAQIEELKTGFNNLLETKLGFVYQAASLVDGVVVAVFDACDNPDSDVAFTIPAFPAFDVAGERVSLWDEPITVDLSDNEVVSNIQTAASPFVVAVLVLAFAHSMENAFYAFVGGQTLIEWIRGRHEE